MRNLYLLFIAGVILLFIISVSLNREVVFFYGVADSREIVVNREKPVEIGAIHVVPGQSVMVGEIMVELHRTDLEMRIKEIGYRLKELKAQREADSSYALSQVRQLRAQRAARVNSINSEIQELMATYTFNTELTSELKSIRPVLAENPRNTGIMQLRIDNLNKALNLVNNEYNLRIAHYNGLSQEPIFMQIRSLEEEIKYLEKEREKLLITAPIEGIVGEVNFISGEKVAPFSPVMTLHTKAPSYVSGFIYENNHNEIKVGDSVDVKSIADKRNIIKGEVVGVGSRIVEFPERLRRRPDVKLWGREVQIRIPDSNHLLLGEKVFISSSGSGLLNWW
ncbi:efflux RND transporter periplasmic adaptor subunit [Chitinispirillales bacterium ANBcel5]|uniref:HlyD family secretion protein n=1 Tax=Cellulosispirillum alkaliphilum TaxID=3039283 RepID=UPI002A54CF9E|nr:efflux RND transporter periplasmic adaptor subunit [Chitinispirillales bacterium ANBcel5]